MSIYHEKAMPNFVGTSAATLAPGASIGTLTVDGDVDFASAGVLAIEIDGNSADRLDVSGLLDLSASGDTLNLILIGPTPNGALAWQHAPEAQAIKRIGHLVGCIGRNRISAGPSAAANLAW